MRGSRARSWRLPLAILLVLLVESVVVVAGEKDDDSSGEGSIQWHKSTEVDQNQWRRDPTNAISEVSYDDDDGEQGEAEYYEDGDVDSKEQRLKESRFFRKDDEGAKSKIEIRRVDIFSDDPLPDEAVRVNPGRLRNFCKVNIQGAVAGDTNVTTSFGIATVFLTCDGPDEVKIKVHPALGRFVKEFTGVKVVKNDAVGSDDSNALVTFVGPQEVAIYNSTVLFLRGVDPELAFLKLEKGINATLTRMNFFDNTGGSVPVLIDASAVMLGSVGFVQNGSPRVAGGIWARNGAQVTAARCACDNNGAPSTRPYAGCVYVEDGSQFIMYGGGLTNNFGALAGAVLVGNGSSLAVEGAHLANNTALSPNTLDVSGALWVRNSNASVNGSALDANKASLGPGAIRVSGQSFVRVSYSQIQDNYSEDDSASVSVSNDAGTGDGRGDRDVFTGETMTSGQAVLQMQHMGVIGNTGGGVRCEAGGMLEINDTTLRDNVNSFGDPYNLDSKDCDSFEKDNLALRNTGYDPGEDRIAEQLEPTITYGEGDTGSFTSDFLSNLREQSSGQGELEEGDNELAEGEAPLVVVGGSDPRQRAAADMYELKKQLSAYTGGGSAFGQFQQLTSDSPFR